jgi:hypothetical protein
MIQHEKWKRMMKKIERVRERWMKEIDHPINETKRKICLLILIENARNM